VGANAHEERRGAVYEYRTYERDVVEVGATRIGIVVEEDIPGGDAPGEALDDEAGAVGDWDDMQEVVLGALGD